jgi:hypothetical protein
MPFLSIEGPNYRDRRPADQWPITWREEVTMAEKEDESPETDHGRPLYRGDETEPYGTVINPNALTREQLLDAVLGNYVVRLNCEEERYDIIEDTSVDWGDFSFEPIPETGVNKVVYPDWSGEELAVARALAGSKQAPGGVAIPAASLSPRRGESK